MHGMVTWAVQFVHEHIGPPTSVASVGLLAVAVFHFSVNDPVGGVQAILAALAASGIYHAVSTPAAVVVKPQEPPK